MPTDIFGYSRDGSALGQVASSEFAAVNIAGKLALVQSVDVSYQQSIDEVKTIGDSNIYWVPGRPSGTVNVTKLVGTGGFFEKWGADSCGQINSMSVDLNSGKCDINATGSVTLTGCVVESFQMTMNSQNQTISETAQMKVATVSK